jgi:hypothetical protein
VDYFGPYRLNLISIFPSIKASTSVNFIKKHCSVLVHVVAENILCLFEIVEEGRVKANQHKILEDAHIRAIYEDLTFEQLEEAFYDGKMLAIY